MFTEKELLIIRDALHEERAKALRIEDAARYNACTVLIGKAATAPAILTKRLRQAEEIADKIHAFGKECEASEYTDTGKAWELLTNAEIQLRVFLKPL